jgi:hypothetical protein
MKVIAINDAPLPLKAFRAIPKKGYYYKGVYIERAYYKGDIFEVYDKCTGRGHGKSYLIIHHDKLETTMDVDPNNFITLEEYRNQKLDQLGI